MPEPFDMSQVMDSDLDVSANYARAFVTIDERRYLAFMAKKLEAKANVETRDVLRLGTNIKGHKNGLVSYSGTMTIYKCTEIFDDILEKYTKTGVMPRFEIQVSNEDPACRDQIGRTSKVFNKCILDGDILLALADAEGGSIEQEINFFAESMTRPEKYRNPAGM